MSPFIFLVAFVTSVQTTQGLTKPDKIKEELLDWLLDGIDPHHETEFEGYDGWYNNPSHPELGSADSHLIRLVPPQYSDGSYQPSGKKRPNPFTVSERTMKGEFGQVSRTGKTAFLVFFGQQVVEEILDAQRPGCPPEYFNIPIPEGHEFRNVGVSAMPFLRTRYDVNTGNSPNNPRRQINEITPWIDGGLTYGTSKTWADTLRSFNCGTLASSHGGQFPVMNSIRLPMANPPPPRFHQLRPVSRFFRLGNPRGNENTFLLAMGTLWFRFHNRVAEKMCLMFGTKAAGSTNATSLKLWNEERIFNEARKLVIAIHQHIIVNDWLPEWLGESLPKYEGWDSSIDPGIATEFQSAAMRFGHTLVTAGGYRRTTECDVNKVQYEMEGKKHTVTGVRTCNSFWNPQEALVRDGIEPMVMGLSSQAAEREDNVIVEDLRGRVFGPLEFSRRDLMAINIQRGRDHAIPDYKTARKHLGLHVNFTTFQEMGYKTSPFLMQENPQLFTEVMPELYGNLTDDVDMWIGGLLETTDRPGELFRTIIKDQFRRIRDGDRFWFQNRGLLSDKLIEKIETLTIYDVLLAGTDIKAGDIQKNPFRLPSDNNDGLKEECKAKLTYTYNCTWGNETITCHSLPPLNSSLVEPCTSLKTFDYFTESEVSYALTFLSLALFIVGCVFLLFWLAVRRNRMVAAERKSLSKRKSGEQGLLAREWVGKKQGFRQVYLRFEEAKKRIAVVRVGGTALRRIDTKNVPSVTIQVASSKKRHYFLLRVPREYDLVLKLDTKAELENVVEIVEKFLASVGVGRERMEMEVDTLRRGAVTFEYRQKQLDKFFRVVFAQAFGIEHDQRELLALDAVEAREIVHLELTPFEFASALAVHPDSTFVQQMFVLVDRDNNGYISFREFLDMMIIFAKGSAEDKMKLMFDMYDIDHSGKLTREEFAGMIKSLLELANQSLSQEKLTDLISSMFREAGLSQKQTITLQDFQHLLSSYKDQLGYTQLNLDISSFAGAPPAAVSRNSVVYKAQNTLVRAYSYFGDHKGHQKSSYLHVELLRATYDQSTFEKYMTVLRRVVENNRLHIFWLTIYTLVLMGIFAERAYYYSVEREHGGLRRIAGYGVTITRGAASGQMFAYATLLLTMCRNSITFLRETFLHRYIPFDSSISMHLYIAIWAGFFSIIHSVGHALNFYHISTQTADDLTCLFREYYHATDELPKFHYWCFGTITGLTGVLLLMLLVVMYVFAIPYARRHVFNAFWNTHNLYPAFYILMVLHGLGRLVQNPILYYFLLGPLLLFVLDRLVSLSRKKIEISVMKAEHLPSDVTMLQLKRPQNFEYRSGQWVRIACLGLNGSEYHPFTLSSAPHEDNLSVHVRALGPWTINLRRIYDPSGLPEKPYPKIYLDGPYGGGHQDWFRFPVSVLVGGGIGVTPFASILKDIAYKASTNAKLSCKKVYFIWITRTQKQFEWMTDIIREVEAKDQKNLVSVHIFITQFYQKFDLRTTMLYICERHFQKISNKSLFTGLKAVTHFGRPDVKRFLDSLQLEHPNVTRVGVFSCGPLPMTKSVEAACEQLNKKEGPIFDHHFENF
ncbi:dual oxidase 2-like [Ornithodoros turicata]|uniref:dual oxidase 2-like n=1 Tax=Ornithodoros turicata TaxID=34597 RepID=UPI003139CBEE